MFVWLTEKKSGVKKLFNLSLVERIEKRSQGTALFYPGRRHAVRVVESVRRIQKNGFAFR